MARGQEEGSIRKDISVEQLVHDLTLVSHGCMMDWAVEKSTATMREFSKYSAELLSSRHKRVTADVLR